MRYIYVAIAMKPGQWGNSISNVAYGIVEAANQDEACGKAQRIGRNRYPKSLGWVGHDANAAPVDSLQAVDPDAVVPCH